MFYQRPKHQKSILTWARKNDIMVYERNAGPTLAGLLSKAAELGQRRSSLEPEIDLARATLMRLVEGWSLTLESPKASEETKLLAERMIREATETIARVVHAAARVRVLDQGAIQLSSVSWVVGEVTRIIDTQVREVDPETADKIVNEIGKIKLPTDGTLEKFTQRAADEAFL